MPFPETFLFGASTASYQIEGASNQHGRGRCVWDVFSNTPGKILNEQNGDVACDHYHRVDEDISLMKEIGLQAYRFSLSWPRILPAGTGTVNDEGLAFYDQLIDKLLASGIEPCVSLFHWDYPYDLFLRGGWLNPNSSQWFADYTALVVSKFSDRVKYWMTLNEPQMFIGLGHERGVHAPGMKYAKTELFHCWHNALLAHGKAVQVIRANTKQPCKIGPVPASQVFYPKTDDAPTIAAAKKHFLEVSRDDIFRTNWLLDPICFGHYPEDGVKQAGHLLPKFTDEEMKIISEPVDFIGHNHYFGCPIYLDKESGEVVEDFGCEGKPLTHFHWPVTPESMYWSVKWLNEHYQLPVIVTENGLSNQDWVSLDGQVHDPQRIDYLSRYLKAIKKAIDEGVDVQGYMQWSLMDNFEWAEGYKHRFGLIFVDYHNGQKRTPKDSARWYAELIKTRGANIGC